MGSVFAEWVEVVGALLHLLLSEVGDQPKVSDLYHSVVREKNIGRLQNENILIEINKKILEGCRTKHIDENKLENIGRL